MAWLFGSTGKIITGFDIGKSYIHVMQAAVQNEALAIHDIRSFERSQEPLADQLSSILSSLQHKVKTVAIALPVEDTVFHPMMLPPLQEKDIHGFVKFEMAKQMELDAAQTCADYTFCGTEHALNGDARAIMGIGIKTKSVDTILHSFEQHRIRVLFAEAAPMALLNCIYACYPHIKQKTAMCVNLDAETITAVIAVNGNPVLIRKIPAKPVYQMIQHRDEQNTEHPILKEIKRTLVYCHTHIQRVDLETVLLTGNGTDVTHIESFEEETLPFSIKPFNILNCASDRIQLHLSTTPMSAEAGLPLTNAAGLLFRMGTGDT